MRIQERDKKTILLCYEHGFIEKPHVRSLFSCDKEARVRIGELVEAGYLRRVACPARPGKEILRLGAAGLYLADQTLPYHIRQTGRVYPTRVFHDSLVIFARMRLEELWHGTWIPEPLLGGGPDIPDGVFLFPSGKKIHIELERSHKSKERFLKKLKRPSNQIATLYIAAFPEVEASIKRTILGSSTALPPAAVILLDNLLKADPNIWSAAGNLSLFHTREF